ncbi:MAG TPA: SUF system NifU family Fe-S cluster assembly protein [Candidatus Nitrosotenuis sp.]|nr:SUF system NifU family Fe-S cluster assembly protein [Candidatus Nitrosotenuis sp.]
MSPYIESGPERVTAADRDDKRVVDDELYREIILDHFSRPRYKGRLERPTLALEGVNPTCGDALTLDLRLEGDQIREVGFTGHGCAISMASASMLAEMIHGRSVDQARRLAQAFKARMLSRGQLPEPPPDIDLGELEALDGVRRYPVRIKCALLAWNTLLDGLNPRDASAR